MNRGDLWEAQATNPRVTAAGKAKRVVVPFSEVPDALIRVPNPAIWEGLESGFVMVLLASAATLILFAVTATANL